MNESVGVSPVSMTQALPLSCPWRLSEIAASETSHHPVNMSWPPPDRATDNAISARRVSSFASSFAAGSRGTFFAAEPASWMNS